MAILNDNFSFGTCILFKIKLFHHSCEMAIFTLDLVVLGQVGPILINVCNFELTQAYPSLVNLKSDCSTEVFYNTI